MPALWAVTIDQFRRRLSPHIYLAVFDDDNDGTTETESATDFLLDAQSLVEGALRGNYTLPLSPVPRVVTALVLDYAQVAAARRHPEVARNMGGDVEKSANARLKQIRDNVIRLDDGVDGASTEAEPINAGVNVYQGNDTAEDGVGGGVFEGGFGDF